LGRSIEVLRERQNREKEQRGGEEYKKDEDREIVFETREKETGDQKKDREKEKR
jgi:hypothetical protein